MSAPAYAAIGLTLSRGNPDQPDLVGVAVVRWTADLADSPSIHTPDLIGEQIQAALAEATPIGHNAGEIVGQLRKLGASPHRLPIDTRTIAQMLDPTAPSYDLDDLCARYGIGSEHPRGALRNAELTRKLFLALGERWAQLPSDAQAKLTEISWATGLTSPLRAFIAAMPGGDAIAPQRRAVGSSGKTPPGHDAPEEEEQPTQVKLRGAALRPLTDSTFSSAAGGAAPNLERRQEQLETARDVAWVIHAGGVGLIEAGTGVGKSLAYLVPAAIWAVARGERVLIATHTKILQSQLLKSDINRLRTMIARESPEVAAALETTVLRGRNNYLCRRNLDRAVDAWLAREDDLADLSESLLARAIVWAESSSTGDREELRLSEDDDDGWDRLSAASASCLRDRCSYVQEGTCFLHQAYKRAERSHLIVGNQALLVASLLNEHSRVPYASVVIIDEAHFLEDVATDRFGYQVSQARLQGPINRIVSETPRRTKTLVQQALQVGVQPSGSLTVESRRTRDAIAGFWAQIERFYAETYGERDDDPPLRLTPKVRELPDWQRATQDWQASDAQVSALIDQLDDLAHAVREQEKDASDGEQARLRELADDVSRTAQRLRDAADAVTDILDADLEKTVSWIEVETRDTSDSILMLKSAPINVGPCLSDLLWAPVDPRLQRRAIVLTSATLTVNKQWYFLRRRLDIPPAPPAHEKRYGSPFDYERNSRIFLATDMPPPQKEPPDEWEAALAQAILRLTDASQGRALVLFTSYSTMNHVADQVRSALNDRGLTLKVQRSDGSPADVAQALRVESQTVVFGVSSLWTGVDIPGEHLSLLIICKMPFDYPFHPVHEVRSEEYADSFGSFTLPLALLRLQQGFGRLIRSHSDRGVCVILDPRVATKNYSGNVRRSLPRRIKRASVEEIAASVRTFLFAQRQSAEAADALAWLDTVEPMPEIWGAPHPDYYRGDWESFPPERYDDAEYEWAFYAPTPAPLYDGERQLDHLVALAEAHQSGGAYWGDERKAEFALDAENIFWLPAAVNSEKWAWDPAGWRPARADVHQRYAVQWIRIKRKWALAFDDAEIAALRELLRTPPWAISPHAPPDADRAATKSYGRDVRRSLPPQVKIEQASVEEIAVNVRMFLAADPNIPVV